MPNSGEYSRRKREQSERDGSGPYLTTLADELRNQGLRVGGVDKRDADNPRIWVELPSPFRLAIAAKRHIVTVYVMAADRTKEGVLAYHQAHARIAAGLEDHVHAPKDPYFALLSSPHIKRLPMASVVHKVVQGVRNFEMVVGS
jgi:hypothetical protein